MMKHQRRAFTLLEVMIALGIFSMILISIYSVWTGILRAQKATRSAADAAQRGRIAMRTIEDALLTSQMFAANMPPQNRDAYYSFLAEGSGDFAALSLVAHVPATFPGIGRFENDPVRRVTFICKQDEKDSSSTDLVMLQGPMLAMMDPDYDPYTLVLAKDVQFFLVDFWGQPQAGANFEWVQEWKSTNSLPKLVRIALGIGKAQKKGEAQDVVYKVIALPATTVMPEWQIPQGLGGQQPPNNPGNPGNPNNVPPGTMPPGGKFPGGGIRR